MRKISKAVISAGLAAATIVSGLSFGAAAATAAPATPKAASDSKYFSLLYKQSNSAYWASTPNKATALTKFGSEAEARQNMGQFYYDGTTGCIRAGSYWLGAENVYVSNELGSIQLNANTCKLSSAATQHWGFSDGEIWNAQFGVNYRLNAESKTVPSGARNGFPKLTNGAGWELLEGYGYAGVSASVTSTSAANKTATLSGTGAPNATLTFNGGQSITVPASGNWTKTVTGLQIGANSIKVEQTFQTRKSDVTVSANLQRGELTASVAFGSTVTDRATVSGTAEPGAIVSAKDADGKTVGSGMADATTGDYSFPVTAPNKAGASQLTVTQNVDGSDVAPSKTVTVNYGSAVKITTPADGATHTGGPVTVSGTGEAGASVVVREKGSTFVLANGTIDANGEYTLTTSDVTAGAHTLEAVQTGKGNNVTTATTTINEGASEIADLVVTTPQANSTVTAPAGNSAQFPNAKVTFTGIGEPGARIDVLRNNDKLGGSTVVNTDGTWTADVDANWVTYPYFTVRQTAGTDVQNKRIENVTIAREGQSKNFAVTSVQNGGTIAAPAGNSAQFPNAKVPFAGEGTIGAKIEVFRENGKSAGTTIVGTDGTWTLDANINWGKWDLKVVQNVNGVKETIQLTSINIARDGIALPFAVTTPQANTSVVAEPGNAVGFPNARLVVSGDGTPGATVKLTRPNGKTAGTGVVGNDGHYSFDADVNWGTWSLKATQTTLDGAIEVIDLPNVTILNGVVNLPFAVTSPLSNTEVEAPAGNSPEFPNARVTFTGEGKAGETITIARAHNNKVAGTGIVSKDGKWSVDADFNYGVWSANVTESNNATVEKVTNITITKK